MAAAGNNSNDSLNYPAAWPVCLAVAATDRMDSVARYSSYGPWVDIAAPGGEGLAATCYGHQLHDCDSTTTEEDFGVLTAEGDDPSSTDPIRRWVTGTSFAAPLVAGVAGLVLSHKNALTVPQLRAILENAAEKVHRDTTANADPCYDYDYDPTGDPGNSRCLGRGRINAYQAILANPPGQGSCPYLFVQNALGYVLDNNLLPDSEFLGGEPGYFTDFYKLMQAPVRYSSGYRLEIREPESDHSFLDGVRLKRIDRHPNVSVAVAPDGRLIKYQERVFPSSAIDGDGTDYTASISIRDGVKIRLFEGDEMVLKFTGSTPDHLEYLIEHDLPIDLLLVVDEKEPPCQSPCPGGGGSIIVQVPDPEGGPGSWQDVVTCHPRAFWEDYIVPLAEVITEPVDTLQVRLLWTDTHSIDMAALLIPSSLPAQAHNLDLLSAEHSIDGSVRTKLLHADSIFAELEAGEAISLSFEPGPNPPTGSVQDFVFATKGYYLLADGPDGMRRIATERDRDLASAAVVRSGPNPFKEGSGTRIGFSVRRAESVSLSVYDVNGRRVRHLFEGILPAGPHHIWWDGRDEDAQPLAPGIYFAAINSKGSRETMKLVVAE